MIRFVLPLLIFGLVGCVTTPLVTKDFDFSQAENYGIVLFGLENEVPSEEPVSLSFRLWSEESQDVEHQIAPEYHQVRFKGSLFSEIELPKYFMKTLEAGNYILSEMTIGSIGNEGSICFTGGSVVFEIEPGTITYIGDLVASMESFTDRSGRISITRWPMDAVVSDFQYHFSNISNVKNFLSNYPNLTNTNLLTASEELKTFTPGKDIFGLAVCSGAI